MKIHLVKGSAYWPMTACGLVAWRVDVTLSSKRVTCRRCLSRKDKK